MEIEKYIVATDQQLIEFVLGGDAIAFEHLFNRYRNSIYQLYICLLYTSPSPRDCS